MNKTKTFYEKLTRKGLAKKREEENKNKSNNP